MTVFKLALLLLRHKWGAQVYTRRWEDPYTPILGTVESVTTAVGDTADAFEFREAVEDGTMNSGDVVINLDGL